MKRIFVYALLVLLSACALLPTDGAGTRVVRLENGFALRPGERAVVMGPRLVVEFVEVLADNRCREGTACFGIGGYTVRLRASTEGAPTRTLDVEAFGEGGAIYGGYVIRVEGMDPDPPPLESSAPDYRLHLRVTPAVFIH